MRLGCHFCEESLPYYRHLGELSVRDRIAFVLLWPESKSALDKVAANSGVTPRLTIGSVRLRSLGILATPTILLVDRGGILRRAYVGKLDDEVAKSILSALEAGSLPEL